MASQTPGMQVTTADTEHGVAITFTTTGDVAALRARVRRMADMHNRMSAMRGGGMGMGRGGMGMGRGGMGMGRGGMGMGRGGMGMHMVPSRATVQDVPGGARIVLVPNDATQLPALRQQARMRADMIQRGECPMMTPSPAPPSGLHPAWT